MGCGSSSSAHGEKVSTQHEPAPAAAATAAKAAPAMPNTQAIQPAAATLQASHASQPAVAIPAAASVGAASNGVAPSAAAPAPSAFAARKRGSVVGLGQQATTADLQQQLQSMGSADTLALFTRFLGALHVVSRQTDLAGACQLIVEQACVVLSCARATLFLVDDDTEELELIVARGASSIRMPRGKGLAGHAATTGETVLIPDAHADPRFDASHDLANNFRTKAVLACPVRDSEGGIIGVLQCINKLASTGSNGTDSEQFGQVEKVLAENFAAHTGLILRNLQLLSSARQAQRKVETLLDIVQLLHSDGLATSSLIFTLTNRAHQLVDGARSTLYLRHYPSDCLVVQQGNVDFKCPLGTGIAGTVGATGQEVNIPDCYADERFDRSVDQKSGFRTKAMLCLPIFAGKAGVSGAGAGAREVIGVLQVINKESTGGSSSSTFNAQDENLLRTLLELSGPILAASSFFSQQQVARSEAGRASDSGSASAPPKMSRAASLRQQQARPGTLEEAGVAEGDEEAEEQ